MKAHIEHPKIENRIPNSDESRAGEILKSKTERQRFMRRPNSAFGLLIIVHSLSPSFQLSTSCAQQLAIDWYTMDGGGGRSNGGACVVRITIGQPDAGASSQLFARIQSLQRHPNGRMQLKLSAATGKPCTVHASTNLADWQPVGTTTVSADGTFEFEDPAPANHPRRFHRLVTPQ